MKTDSVTDSVTNSVKLQTQTPNNRTRQQITSKTKPNSEFELDRNNGLGTHSCTMKHQLGIIKQKTQYTKHKDCYTNSTTRLGGCDSDLDNSKSKATSTKTQCNDSETL